ncbi:hypothetical protein AUJ13_02885 [Candidatus Micrarchaeota archaeon CG1_02_49_24]|nr:MAG: hypothetical protein AUJ13_02885 [Candidatus Micrarchaeota archaeon CG1_02_49_24]HII54001.1 hypothetical protein [Candidatus Micrarchaeota archaeon]
MENYDVIVAGAGPAGAAISIYLGRMGYSVLLLDKASFPRDKICGDGISGKSLRVLKELGLDKQIEATLHSDMYGVIFSSPKGTTINILYPQNSGDTTTEGERGGTETVLSPGSRNPKGLGSRVQGLEQDPRLKTQNPRPETIILRVPSGYCCRREVFDNVIFQEAKKHSTVIEKFQVNDLIIEDGYVKGVKGTDLATKQEKSFRAKLVVGADGATSLVTRKLGLDNPDDKHLVVAVRAYYEGVAGMTGSIEIHFVESILPGYFWIFPLENGKANVGIGMLASDMKKKKLNLQEAMAAAISDPRFRHRFANAKPITEIKGWNLPLGSKRKKNHGNGFIILGDAASLIDPFTGEGIGNALFSAKLASGVVDRALRENDVSEKSLSEYEELLRKEVDPDLKTSYDMQRAGKIRWLLNMVVDKAAKNKEMQDLLSNTLADNVDKRTLISPGFIIRAMLS